MKRIRLEELLDSATELSAFRDLIAGGGLAAIPTETFYGLAVAPDDAEAVERVFALKGRPEEKALLVLGASIAQLGRLVAVPPEWGDRLAAAWPAPLTVVLPALAPLAAAGPGATLAVRVPGHALLRALLEVVGPLTATSANRSREQALSDPEEVARALGGEIALLLDGGRVPGGAPSTVVDLAGGRARVLRTGAWELPLAWGVHL